MKSNESESNLNGACKAWEILRLRLEAENFIFLSTVGQARPMIQTTASGSLNGGSKILKSYSKTDRGNI